METDSWLGGARRRCCWGERLSGSCGSLLCFLLICTVVVTVFPLFAVLLNCPYPDPPVSASFFSFSSACQRGEGRPRGAFVAGGSRNQDTVLEPAGTGFIRHGGSFSELLTEAAPIDSLATKTLPHKPVTLCYRGSVALSVMLQGKTNIIGRANSCYSTKRFA